ncbi:hypothetical protein [Novosphingobium guangzhouense]|uniref:hypothetical protein n=1 Tax=Novosphingobium guangzhouense TaxID=1850347 RepID=UPI0011AF590F|nr:hypothetical protein [Novosphingobium guangzhouense]
MADTITRNCMRCDEPVTGAWMCDRCAADEIAENAEDEGNSVEGPEFECAGYNDGSGFYCPIWGTEDCDWECPRS